MDTRFHCVYLLSSLDPSCAGEYYIGYTVNPLRRLRQHNGELVQGARRTKRRGRPWTIVCCVSGFLEDRAALKFEWCWQHPLESTRLRTHMGPLSGLHRLPYAVGVLHLLLRCEPFCQLVLTLHVFETATFYEAAGVAAAHFARGKQRNNKRLNTTSTTSSAHDASPPREQPQQLPALTPTALLHLEETTREQFDSRYLLCSHTDANCDSSMSCPFDVSALSQSLLLLGGADSDGSFSSSSCGSDDNIDAKGNAYEVAALGGDAGRAVLGEDSSICVAAEGDSNIYDTTAMKDTSPPPPPPLRFRGMTEVDLARDYQRERALLRGGSLPCSLCAVPLTAPYVLRCPRAPFCSFVAHLVCLSLWMTHTTATTTAAAAAAAAVQLVPSDPCPCPLCGEAALRWGALVKDLKQRAVREERIAANQRRLRVEARLQQRLVSAQDGKGANNRNATRITRRGNRRPRIESGEPVVESRVTAVQRRSSPKSATAPQHSLSVTDVDPTDWLQF